jgi:hypothetical protein
MKWSQVRIMTIAACPGAALQKEDSCKFPWEIDAGKGNDAREENLTGIRGL